MLFLEIISWKGVSRFSGGGFIFKWGGGTPPQRGASVMMGELEKNRRMGGRLMPPLPQLWETLSLVYRCMKASCVQPFLDISVQAAQIGHEFLRLDFSVPR